MRFSISLLTTIAIAAVAHGLVIPESGEAPIHTAATKVPHRYIVVLKSGLEASEIEAHKSQTEQSQKALVKSSRTKEQFVQSTRSQGGIDSHYDLELLVGYAGYFLPEVVDEIKKDSRVSYIEEDGIAHSTEATTQEDATWGLARISSSKSLDGSTTGDYLYDVEGGKGVTSFIIDTGINIKHKEFEGRATWGANFASDGDSDGNGHGSHCAGTVGSKSYGVAKKANLVAVKVLGASGSGSWSGIISGLQYAAQEHKKNASKAGYKGSTANMSLGGGFSTAINDAANAAVAAGIHLAVAAGNENQDACNTSPASAEGVVTVGASTNVDARASFSNYGKCVDIFAPGLNILSTWTGSDSATNTISGTSMASPHIAGLLTYFLSLQPESGSEFLSAAALTPAQLKAAIVAFGNKKALTDIGAGSPNVIAFNGAGGDLKDLWKAAK